MHTRRAASGWRPRATFAEALNQVSFRAAHSDSRFTGSSINLTVAALLVRWIHPTRTADAIVIGVMWLLLHTGIRDSLWTIPHRRVVATHWIGLQPAARGIATVRITPADAGAAADREDSACVVRRAQTQRGNWPSASATHTIPNLPAMRVILTSFNVVPPTRPGHQPLPPAAERAGSLSRAPRSTP